MELMTLERKAKIKEGDTNICIIASYKKGLGERRLGRREHITGATVREGFSEKAHFPEI